MKFSLVIPLWNEGHNVESLVEVISKSGLHHAGMNELVLVNNGSNDNTAELVDLAANKHKWILPVHLPLNLNYGGGVYEGFKYAKEDILCYIPGDLQVLPDDVLKIFNCYKENSHNSNIFVKGNRVKRFDSRQNQFVSSVYTWLANRFLGLKVEDVNGLPKMFSRDLVDLIPAERMKSFVFDSQLLSVARTNKWKIYEIGVTFHARREGVSSWSKKRLRIYLQVLMQILRLRKLRNEPGVKLSRIE
jgi:glycosyltransferase involved in cell wall biosynthesis